MLSTLPFLFCFVAHLSDRIYDARINHFRPRRDATAVPKGPPVPHPPRSPRRFPRGGPGPRDPGGHQVRHLLRLWLTKCCRCCRCRVFVGVFVVTSSEVSLCTPLDPHRVWLGLVRVRVRPRKEIYLSPKYFPPVLDKQAPFPALPGLVYGVLWASSSK